MSGSVSARYVRFRRLLLTFGLLGGALLVTGCQEGRDVGAVNDCGFPVQVSGNDTNRLREDAWRWIDDGERSYIGTSAATATTEYVWVRASEDGAITHFQTPAAELPAPPENVDYGTRDGVQVEIILADDRCPAG